MVSRSTAKWPKPKSEDEFEDIVVDFCKARWNDPNTTRNGRRGQPQKGVDIIGTSGGEPAGAQCKNTLKPSLSQIIAEVDKAKDFVPPIRQFLIVVAADRDSNLQEKVRLRFDAEPAPFPVTLVFWDDIILEMSNHPRFFEKHWPDFAVARRQPVDPATSDPHGPAPLQSQSLRTSIETLLCPRPNSLDVDEFVVFTLHNLGTEAIALEDVTAKWRITDGFTIQTLHVSDGLEGIPTWDEGLSLDGSIFECYLNPRGSLEPHEKRTIGFHIFRGRLLTRAGDRIVLRDPHFSSPTNQAISAWLVLPFQAQIQADGASHVGTRTVLWAFDSLQSQTDISCNWAIDALAKDDEEFASLVAWWITQKLGVDPPAHVRSRSGCTVTKLRAQAAKRGILLPS